MLEVRLPYFNKTRQEYVTKNLSIHLVQFKQILFVQNGKMDKYKLHKPLKSFTIYNNAFIMECRKKMYIRLGGTFMVVIVWQLDLQLPMSINTNVVSSNPAHSEVYLIQHYVIKFVSVCGFLRVFRFPPPIKLTARI